jgi:hypothetical protein
MLNELGNGSSLVPMLMRCFIRLKNSIIFFIFIIIAYKPTNGHENKQITHNSGYQITFSR